MPVDRAAFGSCVTPSRLYDLSGNVWEWVDACTVTGCQARGGSYAEADSGTPQCSSRREYLREGQFVDVGCCSDQ